MNENEKIFININKIRTELVLNPAGTAFVSDTLIYVMNCDRVL